MLNDWKKQASKSDILNSDILNLISLILISFAYPYSHIFVRPKRVWLFEYVWLFGVWLFGGSTVSWIMIYHYFNFDMVWRTNRNFSKATGTQLHSSPYTSKLRVRPILWPATGSVSIVISLLSVGQLFTAILFKVVWFPALKIVVSFWIHL